MSIFNDKVQLLRPNPNNPDITDVLAEFNMPGNGNVRWWCDDIEGWANTADLNVALGTYGTADGAFPANRFPAKERYITVHGACQNSSREIAQANMDYLVNACRPGVDFWLARYEPTPKMMKVRLASAIEFPQQFEQEFRWMMTLVVPHPVKLSLTEHNGLVNVFAGGTVYREYLGGLDGDTNWSTNPSFETDVTTGSQIYNTAVFTQVTTPVSSGTKSLKVVTSTTALSGWGQRTIPRTPNAYDPGLWNASVMVRGNVGGEVVQTWMRAYYTDGTSSETTPVNRTLTTTFTEYSVQIDTDESKDINQLEIMVRSPGTTSITYFIDRPHFNYGPSITGSFTGTAYPGNSFHTGTANISPVSRQSEPKSPGKRSYTSYAREYVTESGAVEDVVESAVLANAGNATAYPVTTVTGPLYSGAWEIRNETTGDRLSFRVDIPEGASLVIDHQAQTARLEGQPVEYRKDGKWWGLAPGENQVRLSHDEFNPTATATFVYRDAWRN